MALFFLIVSVSLLCCDFKDTIDAILTVQLSRLVSFDDLNILNIGWINFLEFFVANNFTVNYIKWLYMVRYPISRRTIVKRSFSQRIGSCSSDYNLSSLHSNRN